MFLCLSFINAAMFVKNYKQKAILYNFNGFFGGFFWYVYKFNIDFAIT
jgi:hypothetical protein